MLERMTFDDLLDWRAYDLISPIGDLRADYHAASICAALYNVALMKGGSKRRLSPTDFLLEFKDAPTETKETDAAPTAGWQHMKSIARMHFALSKALSKPKPPRPQRPARPPKPTREQKMRARR